MILFHMFCRRNIRIIFVVGYIIIGVIGVVLWQFGTMLSATYPGQVFDAPAGLEKEDIVLTDSQGIKLSGWLFEGDAGQGVVLILHGLGIDKSVVARRAPFLVEAGYTVFVFDFQAHGSSGGKDVTFGYTESHNVKAAIDFLQDRYPEEKLTIIAASMGGAALLVRDNVIHAADAYILEGVFSTLDLAAENRLAEILGEPGRYLTGLLLAQVKLRLGFDYTVLRPIEQVGALKAPVFVIGGGDDYYTPAEETRALYDAVNAPKDLWIIEGVGHKDFFQFSEDLYKEKILAFLKRVYGRGEGAEDIDRK